MRTTQLIATAALTGLFAAPALAATADLKTGTYDIDPGHSYAYFSVEHMGLSTLQGRIHIEDDSTIQIAEDRDQSQVNVMLDPASVNTGHDLRDKHLRENDGFFEVKKYPEMSFKSTSISFDDDDEAKVVGDLTLHGQTHEVTLDVEDINCRVNPLEKTNYTCGFSAETEIDRTDYGMDAYSELVGTQIAIGLEVEANMPMAEAESDNDSDSDDDNDDS